LLVYVIANYTIPEEGQAERLRGLNCVVDVVEGKLLPSLTALRVRNSNVVNSTKSPLQTDKCKLWRNPCNNVKVFFGNISSPCAGEFVEVSRITTEVIKSVCGRRLFRRSCCSLPQDWRVGKAHRQAVKPQTPQRFLPTKTPLQ
jgi:hypothetical protein